MVEALGVETLRRASSKCAGMQRQATALGQMAFFAEFLIAHGSFRSLGESCPLNTESQRVDAADILGTWLLSMLSGHWRYAHYRGTRGRGQCGAVGDGGVVAEDTVRRALKAMDEEAGMDWFTIIWSQCWGCSKRRGCLDTDVTVKPLYGKQEGALIGYNPHKPGRPSHAYHSYQISGLRLMLAVTVGGQSEPRQSHPAWSDAVDRAFAKREASGAGAW